MAVSKRGLFPSEKEKKFRLAFDENDSVTWKVINWFTDCFFLIDLVLSFFESYYDEENNIHVTSLK